MAKPVCVVLGVGPGNGAAFARRFSAEGHALALLARSETYTKPLADSLPDARAYRCDAADPASIAETFARIHEQLGPVSVLVYNAGSGVWGNIEDLPLGAFERAWRINVLGLAAATQQVIPDMAGDGHGHIIVVGATASRRGGPKTAAFASAKMGQKGLAESLARQLWPRGIHVALLILDGVVNLEPTRARMPDKPEDFFIQPDDVADSAFQVSRQPKSAWSFEVEVRPFGEKW